MSHSTSNTAARNASACARRRSTPGCDYDCNRSCNRNRNYGCNRDCDGPLRMEGGYELHRA